MHTELDDRWQETHPDSKLETNIIHIFSETRQTVGELAQVLEPVAAKRNQEETLTQRGSLNMQVFEIRSRADIRRRKGCEVHRFEAIGTAMIAGLAKRSERCCKDVCHPAAL